MRFYVLCTIIAFLVLYAWKDWFKSLCCLIILMSIIENRNMPTSMFGIQGFNLWNILFLGVFLGWIVSRQREGLTWDMPGYISVLLLLYLGVILIGVMRAMLDSSYMSGISFKYLISDFLINTIKWVLPGIMLFDGCRSRKRLLMALWSILGLYLITAALILRNSPLSAAGSLITLNTSRGAVDKAIGYGAVTVAMMMAGGSWAILGALPLVERRRYKIFIFSSFLLITCALTLTGGRAGYLTWAMLGLIFGILRFRRYLLLVPFGIMLILVVLPGISQRMFLGFGNTDFAGETTTNAYTVSSGRLEAWPYVIDKIAESPIIGFGRSAMPRTGLMTYLEENEIASKFGHPHNAYLEFLLDNGLIGFFIVISFFTGVLIHALQLFRDRSDPLFTVTGMITLSLVMGFLIAGMGSGHFYPRAANTGMWLSIFLTLRVSLERKHFYVTIPDYYFGGSMPVMVTSSQQASFDWSTM